MTNSRTIILCGGKIDFYNLPVNINTSNSMIPINGKPVIAWILDDLTKKGALEITIVLRKDDTYLRDFVNRVYTTARKGLDIAIVETIEGGTILHSLQAGLTKFPNADSTLVILGDTLIKDTIDFQSDYIYIHQVEDSHRWCLAEINERMEVEGYKEKLPHQPPPHLAVCGHYNFSDTRLLEQSVVRSLEEGGTQISSVLSLYSETKKIRARFATEWFDFGNIDNLVAAKQQLLQSRYFNTLTIDPLLNTITKVSTFDKKLNDELNWYLKLPAELQVLTPRVVSSQQIDGKLNLVQEYYGYPTLSELYLFSDFHPEQWVSIIKKVLSIHLQFKKYNFQLSKQDYRKVYYKKTFDRIESLLRQDQYWKSLFGLESIAHNNKVLNNLPLFYSLIKSKVELLIDNASAAIIHGDFCFSNILYDVNGQIVRLIDPRGSFGRSGIYGDPRYDLAKLRHSICGLYDFIVSDLFELFEEDYNFTTRVFSNDSATVLAGQFDTIVSQLGYDPKEIKFIEALLFISMLPLHKDKPLRQKMMFLRGLTLLNEIFDANSNRFGRYDLPYQESN